MKTWNKFWSYFETIIIMMMTICIIVGTDYEKLNNTKDILIYCFITGNGILGSFYFIQKFYNTISNKKLEKMNKE